LDLLPGTDCRDLAGLPAHAEPISEDEVRRLLRKEFGPRGATALSHLESEPVESLALSQTHRAWLGDGRMVSLKLARASALARSDLATLPHLAGHLSSLGWPVAAARRMIAEFTGMVERRMDLRLEAEVLGLLSGLSGERRLLAPRIVDALSSSRVLTQELPPGAPLRPAGDSDDRTEGEATGTTRVLTDLWMRLVFDELRIPEELSHHDVWRSKGGEVELTGGLFQSISGPDADALWRYLVAAAREDPDGVFEAFTHLTSRTHGARPQALKHHLGHVVPRRDGRFGETPPGFPEFLLSHWPQLQRHGLTPGPALLAFYRGLIGLRDLTGPAFSNDVLREALQVTQISRGNRRLRKMLDPSRMTRGAEGVVKMLMEMPRKLERDSRRPRLEAEIQLTTEGGETGGHKAERAGFAIGLLLAATLLMWFVRFPALLGRFPAPAQAVVLTTLGLLLLRWIWKTDSRGA
jgi:hypothetical protein